RAAFSSFSTTFWRRYTRSSWRGSSSCRCLHEMAKPNAGSVMNGQGRRKAGLDVYLTVDVEPDCPPYLWTWRGIEEGMPRLVELFTEEAVPGTFFITGQTASLYPQTVEDLVEKG